MSICATILTNGCEATIADTIRSVLPVVDAVLIVDTGIRDETIQRAKESMQGKCLHVFGLEWPDRFDDARNHCLSLARDLGYAWSLMVDSDERLAITDPPRMLRDIATSDVDVWLIADAEENYWRERLIRTAKVATWHGRTHESLAVQSGKTCRLPGVRIIGEQKTAEQFRAKLERDLRLLKLEIAEHPIDPRWHYYLGQTLEDLGRKAEAADAYGDCWALPGWSEQAAWACYRAACCLIEAKMLNWPDRALEACGIGLSRDGRFPELAWLAGWICYQRGRYAEALAWGRAAVAITDSGVAESRIGFRFRPGWRERPLNLISWASEKLGRGALGAEGPRGVPGPGGKPNIVVLGIGHANTTITTRQLHAMGWHAGDADQEYAESVSVRAINQHMVHKNPVTEDLRGTLAKLPQPWAIKDPRFAYGTLHRWIDAFSKYQPLLLWVTKDPAQVLDSFERRGEPCSESILSEREEYCQEQFDGWPWAKLKIDAAEIGAACELWKTETT